MAEPLCRVHSGLSDDTWLLFTPEYFMRLTRAPRLLFPSYCALTGIAIVEQLSNLPFAKLKIEQIGLKITRPIVVALCPSLTPQDSLLHSCDNGVCEFFCAQVAV